MNMNGFDGNNEQAMLAEVGRATARLIHDFKNQLGGMKLYTAYLKKRFAAHPDLAEGLEIADKIAQSVNEMAENANLIGKLTRPIELSLLETDFAGLVKQVIGKFNPRIAERGLTIENDSDELSPSQKIVKLDSQQMSVALDALFSRAIDAARETGQVRLSLRSSADELQLSVVDDGEPLNDEQRESLFRFSNSERLNKRALDLVLARRIVEAHGGKLVALIAENSSLTGTEVRLTIKI